MAKKYIVVLAGSTEDLESSVSAKLSQGYTLVGGVSISIIEGTSDEGTYAQAMILER